MLIGLCGYTGVGKDEVAKHLVSQHGFVRVAFADAMRDDLYTLNPWIHPTGMQLAFIVDALGWDRAKRDYSEIRRLLQVYGTEVGRNGFGENVWIDRAVAEIKKHPNVVVTDVRFDNEVTALRQLRAKIVHVSRPDHGPINGHASELLDYAKVADIELVNDSDIATLQVRVDGLLDFAKEPMPIEVGTEVRVIRGGDVSEFEHSFPVGSVVTVVEVYPDGCDCKHPDLEYVQILMYEDFERA